MRSVHARAFISSSHLNWTVNVVCARVRICQQLAPTLVCACGLMNPEKRKNYAGSKKLRAWTKWDTLAQHCFSGVDSHSSSLFALCSERAQTWQLNTFLDGDMRISRGDGGSIFVYCRCEGKCLCNSSCCMSVQTGFFFLEPPPHLSMAAPAFGSPLPRLIWPAASYDNAWALACTAFTQDGGVPSSILYWCTANLCCRSSTPWASWWSFGGGSSPFLFAPDIATLRFCS